MNPLMPDPWIFGATVSLLDISILPFIRQCKIANPHWFLEQDFKKVTNLLDYFESSALFHITMKKFDEWNPENPKIVIFSFRESKLKAYRIVAYGYSV